MLFCSENMIACVQMLALVLVYSCFLLLRLVYKILSGQLKHRTSVFEEIFISLVMLPLLV